MKPRLAITLAGLTLFGTSALHAATYVPSFTGLANGQSLVPVVGTPYDNWTQSEPNQPPPSGDPNSAPIAYGQAVTNVPGVAVGGSYSTPVADSFFIQHTVDVPSSSGFSTTLTIGRDATVDSISNTFEIGAYSGAANLVSLVFQPSLDPNIWNLAYRIDGGSNIPLSTSSAFGLNQVSLLNVAFANSGSNTNFTLSLVSGGSTLSTSGTITNGATTPFDAFRVSMLKVPGTNPVTNPFDAYGTNFVAITVPEPSALVFLGLAAGLPLIRRRRSI